MFLVSSLHQSVLYAILLIGGTSSCQIVCLKFAGFYSSILFSLLNPNYNFKPSVFEGNNVEIICIYRKDTNCWLHRFIIFSLTWFLLPGKCVLHTEMLSFKAFLS